MKRFVLLLAVFLFAASTLTARVARIVIDERKPVLDGKSFGRYGSYEYLKGRIWFEIDPANMFDSRIVDIHLAELNENGMVEAMANFEVLQPVDHKLARGVALVEVSNRGGKFSLRYFNRSKGRGALDVSNPDHLGDALLMRQGLTVIWVGWQFDVPDNGISLRLEVPGVMNYDGTPVTGLVRSDWTLDRPANTLSLGHRNQTGYPVADFTDPRNVLTRRTGREDHPEIIPRSEWEFGRLEDGEYIIDSTHICSEIGFEDGYIYEMVYVSDKPVIVGMGLAAIRDIISYAKYDPACEFPVEKGVAAGVSQTGRFLRHFLYQGFNTDEDGRMAYDGLMIITAGGGRGSFNHRFAQPSRDAHRYSAFFYPTDIFPFTGTTVQDPEQWRSDGLLAHMWNDDHIPKIFYCNTGYEYWGRAASLIHTDPSGSYDVELMPRERLYMLASGQHYVGPSPSERNRMGDTWLFRGNPLDYSVNYRSLLVKLVEWVDDGSEPPASKYPRIDNGTLIHPENLRYPLIGGLKLATTIHVAYLADYGPRWSEGIVDFQPPLLTKPFPSMVCAVDSLGNEIAGIRNVEITVPLGTYLPWNLRTGMKGSPNELTDFTGTFIPLQPDESHKFFTDRRPSVERLYPTIDNYKSRVENAIDDLIKSGYVLDEDYDYILQKSVSRYNSILQLYESNKTKKLKQDLIPNS